MARFMTVRQHDGTKWMVDIDEIQAFQFGTVEIRIITKHEFYGLWCNREDVLRIIKTLDIPQSELDAFLYK